jgi:hypothetical protein
MVIGIIASALVMMLILFVADIFYVPNMDDVSVAPFGQAGGQVLAPDTLPGAVIAMAAVPAITSADIVVAMNHEHVVRHPYGDMKVEFGGSEKHWSLMHHNRWLGMVADVHVEIEPDIGCLGSGGAQQASGQQKKNESFHVCYSLVNTVR